MQFIDQSQFLIKLSARLTDTWARRPGIPILAGIVLVVIGFVIQLLNVSAENVLLEYLYVITHNLGILLALIGFFMKDPLGK